jgi:hypothetical protein
MKTCLSSFAMSLFLYEYLLFALERGDDFAVRIPPSLELLLRRPIGRGYDSREPNEMLLASSFGFIMEGKGAFADWLWETRTSTGLRRQGWELRPVPA